MTVSVQVRPVTTSHLKSWLTAADDFKVLILDCRPFMCYNNSRISDAYNVHCPRLLKRRSKGSLPLDCLVTCTQARARLLAGFYQAVVVYDKDCADICQAQGENADDIVWVLETLFQEPLIQLPTETCFLVGGFSQFSLDCPSLCVSPTKSPSTTMQSPPAAPVTITPTVLQPSEHGRFNTPCTTPRTPRTPLLRRGPALSLPNLQCLNAQLPESSATSTPLMPPPSGCQTVPCGPTYECNAPVRLLPHLYLGSNYHASRLSVLEEHGITAVLNVSRCCPNYFPSRFGYMQIPVDDNTDADLLPWFEEATNFIDSVKRSHGRVLVHCQAGISRSATVCLAYLMKVRQIRLEEAFEFVRSMRTVISPNLAFMLQLLRFEAELLSKRKDSNTTTNSSCNGFIASNANISNCEQNTNIVSSPAKCTSVGVTASRQLSLSNSPLLAKRMARSVSLPCPHNHTSSPTNTPPRKQSLAFNFNFPVLPKTAAQSCALECPELSPGLSPIYSPL